MAPCSLLPLSKLLYRRSVLPWLGFDKALADSPGQKRHDHAFRDAGGARRQDALRQGVQGVPEIDPGVAITLGDEPSAEDGDTRCAEGDDMPSFMVRPRGLAAPP